MIVLIPGVPRQLVTLLKEGLVVVKPLVWMHSVQMLLPSQELTIDPLLLRQLVASGLAHFLEILVRRDILVRIEFLLERIQPFVQRNLWPR